MSPATPRSVLVVSSGWPTPEHPGDSIFVKRQVDALRKRGIDVEVMTYEGAGNPRNYARARRQVRAVIDRGDIDLVHAHFGQSYLAVPRTSLPFVITFHGSDLYGIASPGGIGGHAFRTPVLRAISRRAARAADAVIVPSRRLGEQLPTGVPFDVIPIGIDMETFRPRPKLEARAELGLPPERRIVLFCGRPSQPVKRFALAQRVVGSLDEPGADLIWVEDVEQARVALTMAAADALLVTSLHESGPAMVKEALACDLPIVSTDVGDVAEWAGQLDGVVVSSTDDVQELASALESVLRGAASDALRFRGRDAVRFLDEALLAERLVGTYERALGAKP